MIVRRASVSHLSLVLFLALGFGVGAVSAATIGGIPVEATLTFTNPTGTVGPTDSIPVEITASLALDSAAITTDGSGHVLGLTTADIEPYLTSLFGANLDSVNLATDTLSSSFGEGFFFNETFTNFGVNGPPYDLLGYDSAPLFPANFEAGDSVTALFGTFVPTGGTAPAGTYTLPNVAVNILVTDDSLTGDPFIALITVASTSDEPSFTRTVVNSTPEPGTWVLMLTGLALVRCAARRGTRATAA